MKRTARRGFTLVELMLVILIIGITSSIAVPGWASLRRRSQVTEGVMHFRGIRAAADAYFYEKGEYPPSGAQNPTSPPGTPEAFDPKQPGWDELGYVIGGAGSADTADGRTIFRYVYTTPASGKRETIVFKMLGDIDRDGRQGVYTEAYKNKEALMCPTQTLDPKEGRYLPLPVACASP